MLWTTSNPATTSSPTSTVQFPSVPRVEQSWSWSCGMCVLCVWQSFRISWQRRLLSKTPNNPAGPNHLKTKKEIRSNIGTNPPNHKVNSDSACTLNMVAQYCGQGGKTKQKMYRHSINASRRPGCVHFAIKEALTVSHFLLYCEKHMGLRGLSVSLIMRNYTINSNSGFGISWKYVWLQLHALQ